GRVAHPDHPDPGRGGEGGEGVPERRRPPDRDDGGPGQLPCLPPGEGEQRGPVAVALDEHHAPAAGCLDREAGEHVVERRGRGHRVAHWWLTSTGAGSTASVSAGLRRVVSSSWKFFHPNQTSSGGSIVVMARHVSSLAAWEPCPSIWMATASSGGTCRSAMPGSMRSWNWCSRSSFWGSPASRVSSA